MFSLVGANKAQQPTRLMTLWGNREPIRTHAECTGPTRSRLSSGTELWSVGRSVTPTAAGWLPPEDCPESLQGQTDRQSLRDFTDVSSNVSGSSLTGVRLPGDQDVVEGRELQQSCFWEVKGGHHRSVRTFHHRDAGGQKDRQSTSRHVAAWRQAIKNQPVSVAPSYKRPVPAEGEVPAGPAVPERHRDEVTKGHRKLFDYRGEESTSGRTSTAHTAGVRTATTFRLIHALKQKHGEAAAGRDTLTAGIFLITGKPRFVILLGIFL